MFISATYFSRNNNICWNNKNNAKRTAPLPNVDAVYRFTYNGSMVGRRWRQRKHRLIYGSPPEQLETICETNNSPLMSVRQLYASVKNRNTRWKQNLYLHPSAKAISRKEEHLGPGLGSVTWRGERGKHLGKWSMKTTPPITQPVDIREGKREKSKQSYQCEWKAHKSCRWRSCK